MPSQFSPHANEEFLLRIDMQPKRFRAMEHPNAADMVHAMAAGKAVVYRIRDLDTQYDYALKVMMAKFRDSALEQICEKLDGLKTIPGLAVCERRCLSPSRALDTLNQYKNLAYAILMPWMQGQSWFDLLWLGKKGTYTLEKEQSFQLASKFSRILVLLEQSGVAHCDLSPGNVILDPQTLDVELIDVEDMFAPGWQQPKSVPLGTPGYQHRTSRDSRGQWHALGDRFGAAILLGEMLAWYNPEVCRASHGESYFDPDEMQLRGCSRFAILAKAVGEHDAMLVDLLCRAWESDTLDECSPLKAWDDAFKRVKLEKYGIAFEPIGGGRAQTPLRLPFWTAPQFKTPAIAWEEPAKQVSPVIWEK
jgi:hypothetical protein